MKNKKINLIMLIPTITVLCVTIKVTCDYYSLEHENEELRFTVQELQCQVEDSNNEIEGLKAELQMLQSGDCELTPCPLCGETAVIKPVNDDFYIECSACHLKTNFFESKAEIIEYWNKQ